MSESRVREMSPWIGVAALMLWGLALRWPGLNLGYTTDELGTVMPGSAWSILNDPETGVNPPLWRLLFNVPWSDWQAPWWGRRLSLLTSLMTIPLGFALGRRAAGGHALAGLATAALFAVHPVAVQMGTIFRVYATWTCVATWHLLILSRLMSADRPRRRDLIAGGLSALLLPQLHYFAVPWLMALGLATLGVRGRRWLPLLYGPAALGVAAWLPWILSGEPGRRVMTIETTHRTVTRVLSMGLQPPSSLTNPLHHLSNALGVSLRGHDWIALLVAGSVLLHLIAWRRLNPTQRALTVATAGTAVAVAVVSSYQYVRTPTLLFLMVTATPLLASMPARLPRPSLRLITWAAFAWTLGAGMPTELQRIRQSAQANESAPQVAARWRDWQAQRPDRPIYLHPWYMAGSMHFYLERAHIGTAPETERCRGFSQCFVHERVVFAGVVDPKQAHGVLVSFDLRHPPSLGDRCQPLETAPHFKVWDCAAAD